MNHRIWAITSAILLVISGTACAGGNSQDEESAKRRIYIDPETGERRQPTAEERAQMREQAKAKRKAGEEQNRVIEGPDGAKILIYDERDWPRQKRDKNGQPNDSEQE